MFESAELGHSIDKATYASEVPLLREGLLAAQSALLENKKFPVIVLIGGVDGAGKGETVNLLNEWLDPRHVVTHAMAAPTDEERERPRFWRFWRALPPKGKTGIFFGSWYTAPILDRAYGEIGGRVLDQRMEEIVRFERMLTDEGALLLKFWFHLSKSDQRKRLKSLAKDPPTRWRVTDDDWRHFDLYDDFRKISARCLRHTSTANAPWVVVEGANARYRSLTVGRAILSALRARLEQPPPTVHAPAMPRPAGERLVLSAVEQRSVERAEYKERLGKLQRRLNLLSRSKRFRNRSALAIFEGMDASGKGGAIRRVTQALDARIYRIIPFAAPTEEERAQPYLWRFWRHLPRTGQLAIFDRSWYGRVLVERVEKFCSPADWTRAYAEINDFEEQMARHGVVLAKFWLQVSADEQLRRFEERQRISYKNFKITDEDWRNREKWPDYELAVADMIDRTSTDTAPWTLVPANDKSFARLRVLETLCDRLEG